MTANLSILFFTSFFSGLAVFLLPNLDRRHFNTILSFSGAYLFSITVIHILPELFHEAKNATLIGVCVLFGFFLQQVLEYFSSGVEHGHIHKHQHGDNGTLSAFLLLASLSLHSLLEGTLLVHPSHAHHETDVRNMMFGIVLHKIPEAFALISVLLYQLKNKVLVLFLLAGFALTSPFGLIASHFIFTGGLSESSFFPYLFALVAGNFLHISTTIFFESSPGHAFKLQKLVITVLGAFLAVAAEFFL